jgi:hydrogenase maturation protease
MNLEFAKQVADSVLYEGYLLYPYRASAVKNRQRFNFGVLLPPAYAQAQTGNDAFSMQTECLLEGENPRLDVRLRFLQIVVRQVGRITGTHSDTEPLESRYEFVPEITVDGEVYPAWQEAIEREVKALDCSAGDLARQPLVIEWNSPSMNVTETLQDSAGKPAGVLVRRRERVDCTMTVRAAHLSERLWRLSVEVANHSVCDGQCSRDEALPHSLVAAHTILAARQGLFVSALDPPETFKSEIAACRNVGTWPVLLGSEGERDWMLSSPIILYDYPQIAAESAGNFFDGTEIDEMLALRVMTMTDDEKREMRNVDRLARELLERTESLPQEHLLKLHGTMRGLKTAGS